MRLATIAPLIVFLLTSMVVVSTAGQGTAPPGDTVSTVAAGLTNPRGFTWGPDGTLYLTLAGTGGETPATIDGAGIGLFGGPTSSVVTIHEGEALPLANGLPSGNWRDEGWIWGAHDVVFLDGELYILSAGGGVDFGNPDQPTSILRLEPDGSTTMVADIGTWSAENLPASVPPDFNPSGSYFDLEAGDGVLWVSEAVGGRVITVTPEGEITLVVDVSEGHLVPTGMAVAPDGGVYVGFLTSIPYPNGAAKVIHVAADGTVSDYWTGLTAINDIAIGPDGALYAAELATNTTEEPPFLPSNSGRIVRMTGPDTHEAVVTGIDMPLYIEFGPDGALYLTTPAFAPDFGVGHGELLRIDIAAELPIQLFASNTFPEVAPPCAYSGQGC